MLDESKRNGHAAPLPRRTTDAQLARIEKRLAAIADANEQRIAVLRDAIADFTAAEFRERDEQIAALKNEVAELRNKIEIKPPSISKSPR